MIQIPANVMIKTRIEMIRTQFIKAVPAFAVAAFMATAITLLPSFAPQVEAGVPHALAKSDRLPVTKIDPACADQNWPNIDVSCLKRANADASVKQVRLVTTDRR